MIKLFRRYSVQNLVQFSVIPASVVVFYFGFQLISKKVLTPIDTGEFLSMAGSRNTPLPSPASRRSLGMPSGTFLMRSSPELLNVISPFSPANLDLDFRFFQRLDQLEEQDVYARGVRGADEQMILENAIFDPEILIGMAPEMESFAE